MLGENRLGEGTISNLPSLWLKMKAKLEISRGDFLIQKGGYHKLSTYVSILRSTVFEVAGDSFFYVTSRKIYYPFLVLYGDA